MYQTIKKIPNLSFRCDSKDLQKLTPLLLMCKFLKYGKITQKYKK
jgi:hypothetical protein